MADEEPGIVIDPIEAALAARYEQLGGDIKSIEDSIARDEAKIKRLRESAKRIESDRGVIKEHLDDNYQGWDIRQAEMDPVEQAKQGRR